VRKALLLKHAARFIETGLLQVVDNYLQLTQDGIFVSDGIIADLMVD
jgi:oxygen-independent coproporphyrinogen-3 oxidase